MRCRAKAPDPAIGDERISNSGSWLGFIILVEFTACSPALGRGSENKRELASGGALNRSHHATPVAAKDEADLRIGVPAPDEGVREVEHASRVVEAANGQHPLALLVLVQAVAIPVRGCPHRFPV